MRREDAHLMKDRIANSSLCASLFAVMSTQTAPHLSLMSR
jgi:hypothetical protein